MDSIRGWRTNMTVTNEKIQIEESPQNAVSAQDTQMDITLVQLKKLVSPRALTGDTMLLNMGPQHPSTHGVLRLLLELEKGERRTEFQHRPAAAAYRARER